MGDGALRRRLTLAVASACVLSATGVLALLLRSNGADRPIAATACLPRPPGATQGEQELFVPRFTDSSVWLIDPDGNNERRVVLGRRPRWSPDGQWIAFTDGTSDGLHFSGEVCAVMSDGSVVTPLGELFISDAIPSCYTGQDYTWSFDSAFLAYETDDMMYSVSPSEGSASRQSLTHGHGPVWSPVGERLAFSSLTDEGFCGVWAVYLNDRDRHELLFAPGQYPAFSPDGSQIVFTYAGRVVVGDADGGNTIVIADVAQGEPIYDYLVRDFAWSPDGRQIAYFYDSPGGNWGSVYVVPTDGSAPPLEIGEGREPSWSPDGRFIAFSKYEGDDRSSLYVGRADGSGEPKKITSGASPSWSPDGTQIAFAR